MADHDQLFKELLRTFFSDFLALVAPELRGEVSLADIRFLEQEVFHDWPRGKRALVDLLVRLRRADRRKTRTVLVHTEIEGRFRAAFVRRLERYFYLLKGRYGEPVFPILLTLRGGPPGVTRPRVEERLGGQCQVFEYTSFGLGGCDAQAFLERPEPLAWGLAALMLPRDDRRAELKIACLRRVVRAKLADIPTFALFNCIETYLQLTPREAAVFERLRSQEGNEEVRAMQLTWADRMRAEGRKEGRKEGHQEGHREGREEGRMDGARQLLAMLLQQRFGDLPPTSRRRLAAVRSLDRLNRLAKQVLTARSLDELGLA